MVGNKRRMTKGEQIKRLDTISEMLRGGAKPKEIIAWLSESGIVDERTARKHIADARKTRDCEKTTTSEVMIAEPERQECVDVERLPKTRAELELWMHAKLASPTAVALRLIALENAANEERGIARLKALEMLADMAQDVMPDDGREEHILLKVFDESTGQFEEEQRN